jgi:hypothetical protein
MATYIVTNTADLRILLSSESDGVMMMSFCKFQAHLPAIALSPVDEHIQKLIEEQLALCRCPTRFKITHVENALYKVCSTDCNVWLGLYSLRS